MFDLSLARGLDYYTGIIYEVIAEGSAPPSFDPTKQLDSVAAAPTPAAASSKRRQEGEQDESQIGVGSIAGGGRYDELVGMFLAASSSSNKAPPKIPCVGISFGVERIFSIILARRAHQEAEAKTKEVDVFVMSIGGDGLVAERMKIAKTLWQAGISVRLLSLSLLRVNSPRYESDIKGE